MRRKLAVSLLVLVPALVATHYLKVADDGQITRKGYFLPNAGSTSAAYWFDRNVVYAVDYTRGIDILRHTGPGTDGPITNANRRSTGRV